jgi:hypothetical protein
VKRHYHRTWTWLRERLFATHLAPLGVLTLLHVAVTQRGLRGKGGIPINTIPFDFVDSYSRFLVFICDSLRAGALPIWFPYGHAGTPFLVNPQSQLWTPVTWILSIVPGYSLLVAQQQVLLTLLFGSFGAYFLAHRLWAKKSSALLTAIAFNFTSARLCNAEHMDIVTAFSLFPWIFWGIRRVAQAQQWARPVLGIFLGLLVVSGYPGIVLLCPLWFGAWAAWHVVSECSDRAARKKFVAGLGLSLALGAGISSGYWLAIATNLGAFSRGAPLGTDAALAQSLSPSDLWHLVYGAHVSLAPNSVPPDVSMRGLYFGVVALALAIYALVANRSRTAVMLGVGFFLALLMSLGNAFFMRVAVHDLLPVFNLSRFPAGDSRAIAVLAGSLLAGGGMANLLENPADKRRLLGILWGTLVLLLVGLMGLGNAIYPGATPAVMHKMFASVVFMELLVISIALIGVARFSSAKALAICLLVASGLDSGTHAGVDAGLWSVPMDAVAMRYRDLRSTNFDPAKALVPRVDSPALISVGSNDAYLNKAFYLATYSPFVLKRLESLLARGYRGFLLNGKRMVGFVGASPPSEGVAFQEKATAVEFGITRYLPDRVDYVVNLSARTTLVFNEVYFPGWQARIDNGKATRMDEVAGGLRGMTVNAGRHVIATRFSPWTFWLGLVVTLVSWGLALGWLTRTTFWKRRRKSVPGAGASQIQVGTPIEAV